MTRNDTTIPTNTGCAAADITPVPVHCAHVQPDHKSTNFLHKASKNYSPLAIGV